MERQSSIESDAVRQLEAETGSGGMGVQCLETNGMFLHVDDTFGSLGYADAEDYLWQNRQTGGE